MVAFFSLIGMVLLSAVSVVWHGYVFSTLWAWFIVPAFGLPLLSYAMAMGVVLIISFATFHRVVVPTDPDQDKLDAMAETIAHIIVYPTIVLAMGWCIKYFL
jgi:hypothetical protein